MNPLLDNRSEGSPWAWFPVGIVLTLSVSLNLTSVVALQFEPSRYLPVLAAFLMVRFGGRVIAPLLALSLLALFRLSFSLSSFSTYVTLGPSTETALLTVFAALAFAGLPRSATGQPVARSPHVLWAALLILTVAVYTEAVYTFDPAPRVSIYWDVGACLAAIVLGAALGLPLTVRRFAERQTTPRLSLWFVFLIAGALLINIDLRGEHTVLRFGLAHAKPLLLVLCLVLPAMGAFRWTSLLTIVIGCYLAGIAGASISGTELGPIARDQISYELSKFTAVEIPSFAGRNLLVLIDAISLVFLGAIIAPFWQQLPIERLRDVRTTLGLALILSLQFIGLATRGEAIPSSRRSSWVGLRSLPVSYGAAKVWWRLRSSSSCAASWRLLPRTCQNRKHTCDLRPMT